MTHFKTFTAISTCQHTTLLLLLLLQALQLQSLNVLPFSTYNFQSLRSWMQLFHFFIFNLFISFLMSFSHLFFGLPSGLLNIVFHLYTFFLPFSLLPFSVNGQTNLMFVLLRNLLCSYVLLVYLIHRLFWFFMYRLFLL
jgi:hypothetical protein